MHKNIRIFIKIDGIIKGETSNILITVCIHPIRHGILISKLLEKAYFTILYKVLWIQKNYIYIFFLISDSKELYGSIMLFISILLSLPSGNTSQLYDLHFLKC